MKRCSLLLLVLLQGCTSHWVGLRSDNEIRDGKVEPVELGINLPRAVIGSDPCLNGHPDDIAKCQAERQAETNALTESIRNRTQK